jgi:hypothetical protein
MSSSSPSSSGVVCRQSATVLVEPSGLESSVEEIYRASVDKQPLSS